MWMNIQIMDGVINVYRVVGNKIKVFINKLSHIINKMHNKIINIHPMYMECLVILTKDLLIIQIKDLYTLIKDFDINLFLSLFKVVHFKILLAINLNLNLKVIKFAMIKVIKVIGVVGGKVEWNLEGEEDASKIRIALINLKTINRNGAMKIKTNVKMLMQSMTSHKIKVHHQVKNVKNCKNN